MSGGGSQTTTQNSEPWLVQQPFIADGFSWAKSNLGDLLSSTPDAARTANAALMARATGGNAAMTAAGADAANLAGNGLGAVRGTEGLLAATGSTPLAGMGALNGIINGQGPYADTLQSLAYNGGGQLAGTDYFAGVANGTGGGAGQDYLRGLVSDTGGGAAADYYRQVLSGDYLTQSNPFFQQMVDNSIAAARPSTDAAFASTGRLGSGASAAAFADAATRAATSLGYQDYSRERAAQDAAAGSLSGLQSNAANSLASLGMTAAGQLSSNDLAQRNLQLNAGTQLTGQALQAAGLLNSGDLSQRQLAANASNSLAGLDLQARNLGLTGAQASAANDYLDLQAQGQAANYEYERRRQALENYMKMVAGNYGGTSTGSAPGQDNTGAYVGAAASIAGAAAIAI